MHRYISCFCVDHWNKALQPIGSKRGPKHTFWSIHHQNCVTFLFYYFCSNVHIQISTQHTSRSNSIFECVLGAQNDSLAEKWSEPTTTLCGGRKCTRRNLNFDEKIFQPQKTCPYHYFELLGLNRFKLFNWFYSIWACYTSTRLIASWVQVDWFSV